MSVIHATEESFAQEIASGLVLVDFYADWWRSLCLSATEWRLSD